MQNNLKTAPRDIRATAGSLAVASRPVSDSLAETFIRSLLARYRGRFEYYPWRVALAFLQGGLDHIIGGSGRPVEAGPLIRSTHYHPRLQLAPRLALTVLARGDPSAQPEPMLKVTVRDERITATPSGSPASLQPQMRLNPTFQGERIEATLGSGRKVATGPFRPSRAEVMAPPPFRQAVPRVVRRSRGIPVEEEQAPQSQAQSRRPFPQPETPMSQEPGPKEIDVNHLTDQVVQAIDRRIIAQRERLGRI